MIANQNFIHDKFKIFNELIFYGTLPLPTISIGKATRSLGSMKCDRKKKTFGKTENYNFKITISSQFDLTENELEDVLIHEMIHYYIMYKQMNDTSPHGEIFKKIMNDINSKYNRNICISKKNDNNYKKNSNKPRYICFSELADGRFGITIAAKTRIFYLWKNIPKLFKTRKTTWFWSCNPFFNKYPTCLKPKIYIIEKDVAEQNLNDAIELQNDGNTIKRK